MKVYKFGGASVKDASGIRNLAKIVRLVGEEPLFVVVSAIGKSTNALEKILQLRIEGKDFTKELLSFKKNHLQICQDLFEVSNFGENLLNPYFILLDDLLSKKEFGTYDFEYDQIVSLGEIFSTKIINAYLLESGVKTTWLDARHIILTDDNYRAARVKLDQSVQAIKQIPSENRGVCVLQGFIAHDENGNTTTLGREGSDYTAALIAYALDLDELSIWKDVDGVYNADPKIFAQTNLIPELSYKDAVELAFYGASIIHPKTIQPLQKKGIKLRVRSFYKPDNTGSIVSKPSDKEKQATSFIIKKDQVLISLTPRDFSFMDVKNMGLAFQILAKHQHQINLMQNSAISFSVCVDCNHSHFQALIDELSDKFELRYNTEQVLVTIRYYTTELIDKMYDSLQFKLEQRNRSTYQVLLSGKEFEEKLLPILS